MPESLRPGVPPATTRPAAIARRAMRMARRTLGDSPLFLPIVLRATPLGTSKGIQPNTALVIEGFPRSGNTFAYFALRSMMPETAHIATRVHVPAQVIIAARLEMPILYVVREPVSTLASLLIAAPHVPIRAAFAEYVHHHRMVVRHKDSMVVGEFETVSNRFGEVVDALNERFDLGLPPFTHDDAAQSSVFAAIDAHHKEVWGDTENVVPRPSAARSADKAWLMEELSSPRYGHLLEDARDAYAALISRP